MGNKTNKQTSSYGFLKPSIGGIHKKTYGSSRVGKKAKEMVKKNLSLFLKGINLQQMINYSTTNDPSSSSSSSLFNKSNSSANFFTNFSIKSNQNKLAANEIDDEQCHQAVSSSVNQEFALHASPSWQYVASTVGEPRFPHVDALPRTWKESLTADQKNSYCFTAKQMKYQELVYEIILTEQSYVDDLILVYKVSNLHGSTICRKTSDIHHGNVDLYQRGTSVGWAFFSSEELVWEYIPDHSTAHAVTTSK